MKATQRAPGREGRRQHVASSEGPLMTRPSPLFNKEADCNATRRHGHGISEPLRGVCSNRIAERHVF